MKKINYLIAIAVTIIFVSLSSCKKWIDTDINNNPNKPLNTTLPLLLPSAEGALAYAVGGDLSRPACQWMQQLSGFANQPLAYDKYYFTQSDVDNVWGYAMYAGCMKDLNTIMKLAESKHAFYYLGIARVLMAFSIGTMTDLWNEIPYSQAFNGDNGNLTPKYDNQVQIYASLNTLLDSAISDLAMNLTTNIPGADDMIYGGDNSKWTMAAYALKARYALHLSKLNGASAYDAALSALPNAFASNADDLQFAFGMNYNEENPCYQFVYEDRPGDMVMGFYFVDTLIKTNDPRLPFFVDTTGGNPTGSHAGMHEDAANPGPFYCSSNSIVPFITYVEMKFIEAECKFMKGDAAGAATAYNDAVKASLDKVGATDTAFVNHYASETSSTITRYKILQQKYIALFMQAEVFADWRRTGVPVLAPASNGQFSSIPRRYPYPTSERIYNSGNCPVVTLLNRVGWDL